MGTWSSGSRRVAVLQSSYIPWKGYFDIIHDVDEFIFYDEVQFTRRDWRSRNRVVVGGEPHWLSVPAGESVHRRIVDVRIEDPRWQKKHFETLRHAYRRAPYFREMQGFLEEAYLGRRWDYLFELNRHLTVGIARMLGIRARFSDSRDYESHGTGHGKLLSLLVSAGADSYVSGPAARSYIAPEDYERQGIRLLWKDYGGYPPYPQFSREFTHQVSVLDLLFQTGPGAPWYIWGWREDGADTL